MTPIDLCIYLFNACVNVCEHIYAEHTAPAHGRVLKKTNILMTHSGSTCEEQRLVFL